MTTFEDQNAVEPVTALFDEDGNQLFSTAGILSMSVSSSNQFAQHTLENGVVISDNKIKLQNKITVKAIPSPEDYKTVYQDIKAADNDNTKFTIQSRVDTYDNMYIESRSHEESSKISNTIALIINFIEQQYVGVTTTVLTSSQVKTAADADTTVSGTKVPDTSTSSLKKISNYLEGLF